MGDSLGRARDAEGGLAEQSERQGGRWHACHRTNSKYVLVTAGAWGKPSATCCPHRAKVGRRSCGCQVPGRDFKVHLQHRLQQMHGLPPMQGALAVGPVPSGKSTALEKTGGRSNGYPCPWGCHRDGKAGRGDGGKGEG